MPSLIQLPNPILTTPSKPVMFFDKKLVSMIADMKKVLLSAKNPKGVGLAGPQAGFPYRIFLTKPTDNAEIRAFINPEILHMSDETVKEKTKLEGCLSIPTVWGQVNRRKSLTLRYRDEKGQTHEEVFDGLMATIIQHETDHTNGILFTHRVIEQKGKFYQIGKDEKGKEVLEELTLP